MKNTLSALANAFYPGNMQLQVGEILGKNQLDASTFLHVYSLKTDKEIFCSQSNNRRLDFACSSEECSFHVHCTSHAEEHPFTLKTLRGHHPFCKALSKQKVTEPVVGRLLRDLLRHEKLSPTKNLPRS
ncbi:hypothetical protein GEMRC1_000908 [Eukaryota sp. GEM-RC1]